MEYSVKEHGYPEKIGYYYVRIQYQDCFLEDKYLWNGEDFVVEIGRSFTNEVVAWKE